MNLTKWTLPFAFFGLIFIAYISLQGFTAEASPEPAPVETGIAVVELFTSQGCSSCPPADKLLTKLINESESTGKPVYALSFHVDYWNRLGWKDPFSDKRFSIRQRDYANALQSRVYTPQMVVNGASEFVGSQEKIARSAISKALSETAKATVSLNAVKWSGNQISAQVNLAGELNGTAVHVALIEKELSTAVPRGENRGRQLLNNHVVRSFETVLNPKNSETVSLKTPQGLQKSNTQVIVYVQRMRDRKIIGATATKVHPS